MKRAWNIVSDAFAYLFAGCIFILFSPLFALMFIIFGPRMFYEWLWAKIRKDPKVDLSIHETGNNLYNEQSFTKEGYGTRFSELTEMIKKFSNARMGSIDHKGYEIFESNPPETRGKQLSMSRALTTDAAEIKITLDLTAKYDHKKNSYFVETGDREEFESNLLPISIAITRPQFHINRDLTLYSVCDLWVIISLLRGDLKFTHDGNQLWAYIKEKDVWIVQYKPGKDDYGLRNNFENKLARKYHRDM